MDLREFDHRMTTRRPTTWAEFQRRLGATPTVPINVGLAGRTRKVLLKLEGSNPFGSIKDRTAFGLLRSLESTRPGETMTIVESTSGNLGAALAALCRLRGHRFIAVVDPSVSPYNLALMEEHGARIEMASERARDGSHLAARLRRVRTICASEPGTQWTNQYANPANPAVHYRLTAPEIAEQGGPELSRVYVAASTGGTLAGIQRYFTTSHEGNPVTVTGVDAKGSVALGGAPGRRNINGYGASRMTEFSEARRTIGTARISDAAAIVACRKLVADTGLCLGGSSGAVLAACVRQLATAPDGGEIVCVCPDYGVKYQDSLYDDTWADRHGIAVGAALGQYQDLGLHFSMAGTTTKHLTANRSG